MPALTSGSSSGGTLAPGSRMPCGPSAGSPGSGRGRSRVGPLPPCPCTVITSNAHHNRPSVVLARLGCRA